MNVPTGAARNTAYPAGYGHGEPAQYGVYDKPADRRLAPWIILGSLLMAVCICYSHTLTKHHAHSTNRHLEHL